jgi:hypothetical protein
VILKPHPYLSCLCTYSNTFHAVSIFQALNQPSHPADPPCWCQAIPRGLPPPRQGYPHHWLPGP